MARQCNECERPADIDLWYLDPEAPASHFSIKPCCADHALQLHRKPRNKPRNGFYLRAEIEREQVMRELLKSVS